MSLTKRDLEGYIGLVCELEREEEAYKELSFRAEGKGVDYGREPIKAGIGKAVENQAVALADKGLKIDSLKAEIKRIEAGVEGIGDPVLRVTLKYLYYDGYSLSKAARKLKKNRNTLGKMLRTYWSK